MRTHKDINRKSFLKRKKEIRDLIKEAKSKPCLDCGVLYPYYVMDLDHVRGVKKFNLSIAAQKKYAISTIESEIAKCESVCSNCHRERTFNRPQ